MTITRIFTLSLLTISLLTVINCSKSDSDKDGFTTEEGDCNDDNSNIYPGAPEICGDGVDQDCRGGDLSCADVDRDSDGFTMNQGDCNDNNANIFPGAVEVCDDGVDQDCNGSDLDCNDVDDDGDGYTENQGDCDDQNPGVNPNAAEICDDGVDQDCDGTDLDCNDVDDDDDGYTENQGDCDDQNPGVNPNAAEICGDGVDQDCDGSDEACNQVKIIPGERVSGIRIGETWGSVKNMTEYEFTEFGPVISSDIIFHPVEVKSMGILLIILGSDILKNDSDPVFAIIVSSPFVGMTPEGITLGSTKSEVRSAYGNPNDITAQGTDQYDRLGIWFSYDTSNNVDEITVVPIIINVKDKTVLELMDRKRMVKLK